MFPSARFPLPAKLTSFVGLAIFLCFTARPGSTVWSDPAVAADPATSLGNPVAAKVSERFAGETEATPDFQRHVMPLLGRLGCNGRSCHGSFQGRGGFALSLFGYDFQADHAALLDADAGRVNVDDAEESLILAKPTDADMHEGGKRFEIDGWQANVLRRWISDGAKRNRKPLALTRLQIVPSEISFRAGDAPIQLTATAFWADGTREDVTDLCRFSTNDDSVAVIDESGLVAMPDGDASRPAGDTHVIVAYDAAVVPVAVLRPYAGDAIAATTAESSHSIDRLIGAKLDQLGITPSGLCTDAEFIRRASLDITGTLPAADEVRTFLADASIDKRSRLINDLLDSPGYAAWFATRMSDWTGNSEAQLNNAIPIRDAASRLWYEWLRVRLDDNVPYDEIVAGIVTADSRQPGESYTQFCEALTAACQPGGEAQFASRDGMPFFWARRNFAKPEERAIGFAYSFLGVRIECAQCHKHPFDRWSKDDFDQFAKLFQHVEARPQSIAGESRAERNKMLTAIVGDTKLRGNELRKRLAKAADSGRTVPFFEIVYNNQKLVNELARQRKKSGKADGDVPASASGQLLGADTRVDLRVDPRDELMAWLRDPANPYFAPAIVNRVWSNYFGSGIVDPTDDMNLANPPSNAALLEHLAAEFVTHDFDLKWLSRTITHSDAYQRATQTNPSNESDRRHFSRHVPRRLPAEVIHDAVLLATQSSKDAAKMREQLDDMAIANSQPIRRNGRSFALQVFGQSERESNCDCDRSDSPSLLQALYLRNDFEIYRSLSDADGWVAQACRELGLEPGGNRASGPNAATLDDIGRKAELARQQIIQRIQRFHAQPEKRQAAMRPILQKDHARMRARFGRFGYEIPDLDDLLAAPDGWTLTRPEPPRREPTGDIGDVIEEAYLRTLSRMPDADEREIAANFIDESNSPADGIASLMWALVNTKEFIITH